MANVSFALVLNLHRPWLLLLNGCAEWSAQDLFARLVGAILALTARIRSRVPRAASVRVALERLVV